MVITSPSETVKKERAQRWFYVKNYQNALEDYMKNNRFNQTEALQAIDISYSVHTNILKGNRVDWEMVRRIETAGLDVKVEY